MTARILQFRPRLSEEDITSLATEVFRFLAENAQGVDRDVMTSAFRKAHPDLKPADLINAVSLAIKVLLIFQRFVLDERAHVDDDPEGAA